MKILISGGCKNGKSNFAQTAAVKLAGSGNLYYVATMIPSDEEDRQRIARHVENRRGMGFQTLECGRNLPTVVTDEVDKNGVFLVDSITALLMNEMYPAENNWELDKSALEKVKADLLAFSAKVENAVFVSDYLYSDAARYDEYTEAYRRGLASLDRALAEVCDVVLELCAGNVISYKGEFDL